MTTYQLSKSARVYIAVYEGKEKEQVMIITSVMIYHRGASLSEQHTDLPCNWSLYKAGFVAHK